MSGTLVRVWAMFLRYAYLHRRSVPRTLEIIFWPVMDLLVWGFVALYVEHLAADRASNILMVLVSAMIFWDVLYRSQQAVSISFMEDIWTQNITNLLISPLRISEWLVATFLYGMAKTLVITFILAVIALLLYRFNLWSAVGFYLVPMMANLFLFGWAVGIFTSGMILRWGYAAEALNWGVPFLIQPISAVFYPLSVLPVPMQWVSKAIPSTWVFEGMRQAVETGSMPGAYFWTAFGLNLIYFVLGALFFKKMHSIAYRLGRLGKLGMD